ncbi:MAG: hypothetical protein L3J96_05040, partial [Thermoplasmata archaeon]|nr:hypothetical protein [Thermoplasmata archaeon]
MYSPPTVGGLYVPDVAGPTAWNFTWMKAWCNSRTPHCSWLGYLPGELNNTQSALHVAEWFHSVLGFVPTYWQFDNEPDHWTHYGKNRTAWTTSDNLTPTGLDYATMVRNYLAAVSAKYPSDRYIGIESSGPGPQANYTPYTAELDGAKVSAMAYHSYPSLNGSATSV